MVRSSDAQAFLARVVALSKESGVNLNGVLQPSIDDETELRRLFATDRNNLRLSDPYVGLVDIFDAPPDIRTTRARVIKDEENLNAKYVLPLTEKQRRKDGEPCMVANLEEFKRNWNIFTEGSLSQLVDWSNVIAAGGSVQACLAPLADEDKVSKRATRKYYHSAAYPSSDIDLFLWGLTLEQAEKKIVTIYEAVRDSVPWDVTCVRTKNTVSIHSQYPYRSVQIVLRLYHSPAEVLAGFDIDAPCCAYNGMDVWANPRAIVAMMRQCNTTDVTRRSPSYEVRLAKYAKRGFEIYVPSLVRLEIDPTIFERSIVKIEGLARLLVLEKLGDSDRRHAFLESRRAHRGRPQTHLGRPRGSYRKHRKSRKYKGDLKLDQMDQLEMNNYDVGSLHIPYGPGWDARRIDRLIYQTDLGMNSTFNPKNKGRRLHRHPAFFGTVQECMEDCCENCPEPIDDAERELQTEEDEKYIRGRIMFMQENPGRQIMTGSFKPIDVGEWSAQIYIGPTERFFTAIAANDRAAVGDMVENGTDVNRRDHVGRSPLHFAIMCNATDIACDLIDAGARMTARLVDGRTSLHLAVQHDQISVVRKLLGKSAQNKESAGTKDKPIEKGMKANDAQKDRPSSEDDWSSEDDGVMEVDDEDGNGDENEEEVDDKDDGEAENCKPAKHQDASEEAKDASGEGIPDDNDDVPDVFDLALADWDHSLTPIAYAVIFASLPIIEDLIASGADVKESTKSTASHVHPLLLTAVRPDEDEACKIAERLILAGATSSLADSSFITVFLRIVTTGRAKLVSTILRCDPNANAVVNFPSSQRSVVLPIILAIRARNYALVAVLLAYGAKLTIEEDDIARVLRTRPHAEVTRYNSNTTDLLLSTFLPIETAVARNDDIVRLLVGLGAEVNICIQESNPSYIQDGARQTILDWVTSSIQMMEEKLEKERKEQKLEPVELLKATSWKDHAILSAKLYGQPWRNPNISVVDENEKVAKLQRMEIVKDYLGDVKSLLLSIGAKAFAEISKVDGQCDTPCSLQLNTATTDPPKERTFDDYGFVAITSNYYSNPLPKYEVPRFHELFQACFDGDNEKIQALCLPAQVDDNVATPLQITVQLADPHNQNAYYNNKTGITPFSVAIANRKWDTARFILAIASAQYEKKESDAQFSSGDIELDDDASDHESDRSDDSDMTVDQGTRDNDYVDISKQPSALKCTVNPSSLLTNSRMYGHVYNNNYLRETPLDKAIREDDTETFVKILNMADAFSIALEGLDGLLDSIIRKDNTELLDVLIRHTGTGIDFTVVRRETTGAIAINDSNKLYLGLSIHGKKRLDLARKHDPNASNGAQQQFPLLWKALVGRAERIVDYLSSKRPYTAYRAYAVSRSDERAERLRKVNNLKELLPQWLGFRANTLGESPLTAAVLSGNMEIVKVLFAKHKQSTKAALHEKWKPLDLNILQIAVRAHNEPGTGLLDFLLAKNISPLEVDTNGSNIYHFLCSKNKNRLLKYFLEKLPADVNKTLLAQQTGERLMTPLHFAAEGGALKAVEMILLHSNDSTMMCDSNGNLPLHVAVSNWFPQITRLLINATPLTLFKENGVGNTALETITTLRLQGFLATLHRFPNVERLSKLTVDDSSERFDLIHLEKELPLLHEAIDSLTKEGRLRKDTKLHKELIAFADVMESHMQQLQQGPEIIKKLKENDYDQRNLDATHESIQEALKVIQGKRELIHVIDVQKSVDRSIMSLVLGVGSVTERRGAQDDSRHGLDKEETLTEPSFVESRITSV
ncbi:ankyrin repeat protein [Amanita muscaria]